MWVTYFTESGEFFGYGRLQDLPDPTGFSEVDAIEPASESGFFWDPISKTFKSNPKKVNTREFMGLFTIQERIAIKALSKTDPIVEDFLWLLAEASYIDGSDQSTEDGLNYLAAVQILSSERLSEIKEKMGIY